MNRRSRPMLLGLLIAVCLALPAPAVYADTAAAPSAAGSATATPSPAAPSGASTAPSPGTPGNPLAPVVDPLLQQARDALSEVKQLFTPPAFSGVLPQHPVDATMALRNLSVTYHALPRKQRAVAARYLMRPTDVATGCQSDYACYRTTASHRKCQGHICVHWVTKAQDSENGVPAGDFNGVPTAADGTPGYVMFTLKQMQYINSKYVGAGYRQTRSDGTKGGTSAVDIYLANVGNAGVYGYCTSDDPKLATDRGGDKHPAVSAYCVLDNDFSHAEFPAHTPAQNLEVTAAHEYFHAVQFGYDYDEDAWMMEATAVWAEDELYNGINDNRQYLRYGPMHRPHNPLDAYTGLNQYGAWCFFRYLTEHHAKSQNGLPVLIRQIWTRAASSGAGSHGQYSLAAINSVLGYSHTSLAKQFVNFAMANRFPGRFYKEGASYPAAPLFKSLWPSSRYPAKSTSVKLPRLSARTIRYSPGKGLRSASRIRITVTGPSTGAGGAVAVRVKRAGQKSQRVGFRIGRNGDGSHVLAFGRGRINWIEVTVLNDSRAYKCNVYGANTAFWTHTCQGNPVHNSNTTKVAVRALR